MPEEPPVGDVMPSQRRNTPANGLTGIPRRIHCAATTTHEGEYSETDQIMVDNFLHTIAEVALAVASRRARQNNDDPA